jgi:XTP/dITP diphosphohydrolase
LSKSKLLLATHNQAKAREYKLLLQDLPFELVTLEEMGIQERIEEEGASLEENALAKARGYSSISGLLTLAEDSGLEVESLGGEPGVRSARYGEATSDTQRISLLLQRMDGITGEERKARFRCVIALALPDGRIRLFSGECWGLIALEPSGQGGFGYDPIFYLPQLGKTLAQLPIEKKNEVSHRGQAARKLRQFLLKGV